MHPLPIYTTSKSTRLIYVLDWLFGEQLQTGYRFVDTEAEATSEIFLVSYGAAFPNAVSIPDIGLLWETNIAQQEITMGNWEQTPTLFSSKAAKYTLPFDLFSAIFFLLSRYEEYLGFTPDKHGRYPANNSILFSEGLLERPIADEWVEKLRQLLSSKYSLAISARSFKYQPTYDIDIAWSYKYKGFYRSAGALVKNILSARIATAKQHLSVLAAQEDDPYDSFGWMQQLHHKHGLNPKYFVLASLTTTAFDKNIHPEHPQMQMLIKSFAAEGSVGMHPSYYSSSGKKLVEEKACLEKLTGKQILDSRQHYIKLQLPGTYRTLLAAGITDDYSMGYGTHLGFRAGTGHSFLWFDLTENRQERLRIHPFCFMDTTAHFDNGLDATTAFDKLKAMSMRLKASNSQLITVFHNFSLGTDTQWSDWKEKYAAFVAQVIS